MRYKGKKFKAKNKLIEAEKITWTNFGKKLKGYSKVYSGD